MNKDLNRREFLVKTAAGLTAGLGLGLTGLKGAHARSNPKIVYRTLGRTGLQIPIVSFGVMNSDSPELILKALDMGFKHLDTAWLYLRGNSERQIGRVLAETGRRKEVYLATKMRFNRDREKLVFLTEGVDRQPGATEENFNRQLDESLSRLRTDYIDILYIHSCYSPAMAAYEPLMNAIVKAKKAGKARFIGTSTHHDEPNVIRATVDAGIYDVVLTAFNYLQDHNQEIIKAIDYAAGKGVGVIAMKTQGGVQLNQEKKIEVNHTAALKWVLNHQNVHTAIPGITAFEQMDLDFGVMEDLTLTDAEKRDLGITSKMSGTLFCQNCRQCLPGCPRGVEIPALMRAYMYAHGYGNFFQAEQTISEIPPHKGLENCSGCTSCSVRCSRGIDIGSRLRALPRLLS